jgi:hypothetical protein
MSWQSLADVFEYVQRAEDLSSSEVLVLLALANFFSAEGTNAYPSQHTLKRYTKLSIRTLRSTVRKLELRGVLITQVQRGRYGRTLYTLRLSHVNLKAATIAGLPQFKAAKSVVEKRQPLPVDPGSKIQHTSPLPSSFPFPLGSDEKPVPTDPTSLKGILARLGMEERDNIYQWALEPVAQHNGNGNSNGKAG